MALASTRDGLLPSPATLVLARADCDQPVVIEDGGEVWTWRRLASVAHQVSCRLAGVSGRPVVMSAPDGGAFVSLLMGVWLADGVPAPVSARLPPREREKLLAAIDPSATISTADLGIETDVTITVPSAVDPSEQLGQVAVPRTDPDSPGIVLCTSGTTGTPKPVVHTTRGVWGLIDAVARKPVDPDHLPPPRSESPQRIESKPMVHVGSIYGLLFDLWRGRGLVVMKRFDPVRYAELVRSWNIETLNLVPSMIRMLLDADVGPLSPPAKLATTGTAPLPEQWRREFESRVGVPVQLTYGSTEAGGAIAYEPLEDIFSGRRRPGTSGRVVPNLEVEIRDPDGRRLADGEGGQIWVRGPALNPSVLGGGSLIDEAGWIDTGDVGHLDEEHYIYLTGRSRDLIIRGGLKMTPAEIESVLFEHPQVSEAVVAGVPDSRLGEVPVAWVRRAGDLSSETLRDFVRARLTAYKVPTAIHFVEDFPRTETGKVRRDDLVRSMSDQGQTVALTADTKDTP